MFERTAVGNRSPNILIISICSFRYKLLSDYTGSKEIIMPAFEKFHVKTGDFRSGKPAQRNFLLVVNESTQNECHEDYHMMFMVDITDETKPFTVSNYYVPEKSGDFCGAIELNIEQRRDRLNWFPVEKILR